MKNSLVERIADAVLYEGYLLYPYRRSAVKNQQRWNFGALCPESYSRAQAGTENWTMQTQCLIESNPNTRLNVKVRFLHLLIRELAQVIGDCSLPISECGHRLLGTLSNSAHFALKSAFEPNGQPQAWQEAVERDVYLPAVPLDLFGPVSMRFSFPPSETAEPSSDETNGENTGIIIRRQEGLEGVVEVRVEECGLRNPADEKSLPQTENPDSENSSLDRMRKITIQIRNLTPLEDAEQKSRDDALMRSFVSTHTILSVENGQFVSLLDPPEVFREAAAACSNVGTYPVLSGVEGTRDCMLSSPIILYDYPQIAPESAGSLFDGTEIDEILTLRIMTLTDEEKREIRGADDRARQILERTEALPVEQLMKMHGAMKGVK